MVIQVLPFLNNPKDLDPSYKMDLDFWDCFGRKKTLSYNQRNTVITYKKFPKNYLRNTAAEHTSVLSDIR